MQSASKLITLNTGHKMPSVGYGLWKLDRSIAADRVYEAIKSGYRLFDGACDYGNEVEVGQGIARAINEGLVKRSDLFITSKLWNTYHKREHILPAIKRTLKDLNLDYLDLYLVHFPIALKYVPFNVRYPPEWSYEVGGPVVFENIPYRETWEGMEELYDLELVKNIGISNTPAALVYDIVSYARIRPSVMQIELHPYLTRRDLVRVAQDEGIAVTAYSSFGDTGYHEIGMVSDKSLTRLLEHDAIVEISKAKGKSPAQVLLRWAVQRGCAVIPKSSNEKRMKENLDLFGFELSEVEMGVIFELDKNLRFNDPAVYANRPIWAN